MNAPRQRLFKNDRSISKGRCLCGAVRFEIRGPMRGVVNCHCSMCRRTYGSYGAHTRAPKANLTLEGEENLIWYQSSESAIRAFCKSCGTSLFWDSPGMDTIGISAGTLDCPTGLETIGHIFAGDKADFYEINDDLPQYEADATEEWPGGFGK